MMERMFARNKADVNIIDAPAFGIRVPSHSRRFYSDDDSDDSDIDEEESDSGYYGRKEPRHRRSIRQKKKREMRRENKYRKISEKKNEDDKKAHRAMVAKQDYEEFRGSPEEVEQLLKDMSRMKVTDPEYTAKYFKVMLSDMSGTARNFVPKPQMAEVEKKQQGESSGARDIPPHMEMPMDNRPPRTMYPPRTNNGFEERYQNTCYGCGQPGHNSQSCPAMRHLMMDNLAVWDWGQRRWTLTGGRPIHRVGDETLSEATRRMVGQRPDPAPNRVNYFTDAFYNYYVGSSVNQLSRGRYATHPDELDYPSVEDEEEYERQARIREEQEESRRYQWQPEEGKTVSLLTRNNPGAAAAFNNASPRESSSRYQEEEDYEFERNKLAQEDNEDPMYDSGFADDSDYSSDEPDSDDDDENFWNNYYEDMEKKPLINSRMREDNRFWDSRTYFSGGSAYSYPALRDQPTVTREARSKAAGGGYQFAQNRRAQEFQEGLSIAERQKQRQQEASGRNQARAERMSARSKRQDHEEDVAEERRLTSNLMRQKTPPPQDFSSRHAKEPASVNEDVQMRSTEPAADKTVPKVSRNEPVRANTPTVRQPGQAQANALRPTPFDAWSKRRPSNVNRNDISFERGRAPFQRPPLQNTSSGTTNSEPQKSSAQAKKPEVSFAPEVSEKTKDPEKQRLAVPVAGRRNEVALSTNPQRILKGIMDTTIAIPIRELLGVSKDLRQYLKEQMKERNSVSEAINSQVNYLSSEYEKIYRDYDVKVRDNWGSKEKSALIEISVTIQGKDVLAIVDTGSEMNIVNNQVVSGLKEGVAIKLNPGVRMRDANNGESEMMGEIGNVLIKIAQVPTYTSLYVKKNAPFDLLLGRPWQQQNLVTIDERMDGTYLVFKDQVGQPEFEYKTTNGLVHPNLEVRAYSARIEEVREEDSDEESIKIITTRNEEKKKEYSNEEHKNGYTTSNAADDEGGEEEEEEGTFESDYLTEDDATDDELEDIMVSMEDELWLALSRKEGALPWIMNQVDRDVRFRLIHATVWAYFGYKKKGRMWGIPDDLLWVLKPLLSYFPIHIRRPLSPLRSMRETDVELMRLWDQYQLLRDHKEVIARRNSPGKDGQIQNSLSKLEEFVESMTQLNDRLQKIEQSLKLPWWVDTEKKITDWIESLEKYREAPEFWSPEIDQECEEELEVKPEEAVAESIEERSISSLDKKGLDIEEDYARKAQRHARYEPPQEDLYRKKKELRHPISELNACKRKHRLNGKLWVSNQRKLTRKGPTTYRVVRQQTRSEPARRVLTVFRQAKSERFDTLYEEQVQLLSVRMVSSLEQDPEPWELPGEFNGLPAELRADLTTAAAYIYLDGKDSAHFPELPDELTWVIVTLAERLPQVLEDVPSAAKMIEQMMKESEAEQNASAEEKKETKEIEPDEDAFNVVLESEMERLQDELSLALDMSNESILPWMVMQLDLEVQDALSRATVWTYFDHKPESRENGVPKDLLWMLPPLLTFFPKNMRSPPPEIRPAQETNDDLKKLWFEYKRKLEVSKARGTNDEPGPSKNHEEPELAGTPDGGPTMATLPPSGGAGSEPYPTDKEKLLEDVFKTYYLRAGTYDDLPIRLYIHEEYERGEIITEAWKRFAAIARTQGDDRGTPMRYSGLLPSSFVAERIMAKELPKHRASDAEIHLSHHVRNDEYEIAEEWSLGSKRAEVVMMVEERGKENPTRIREGADTDLDRETDEERKYQIMQERVYATYFDPEHAHDYLLASIPPYLASIGDKDRERIIVEAWGRRVVYLRMFEVDEGLPPMLFSSMLPWSADESRKVAESVPWYLPSDAENLYANRMRRKEEQDRWSQYMVNIPEEEEEEEEAAEENEIRGGSKTPNATDTVSVLFRTGLILEAATGREEHMEESEEAQTPHETTSTEAKEAEREETWTRGRPATRNQDGRRKGARLPSLASRHRLGTRTHLNALSLRRQEFALAAKRAAQNARPKHTVSLAELRQMQASGSKDPKTPENWTEIMRRNARGTSDILTKFESLRLEFFRDNRNSSINGIANQKTNEEYMKVSIRDEDLAEEAWMHDIEDRSHWLRELSPVPAYLEPADSIDWFSSAQLEKMSPEDQSQAQLLWSQTPFVSTLSNPILTRQQAAAIIGGQGIQFAKAGLGNTPETRIRLVTLQSYDDTTNNASSGITQMMGSSDEEISLMSLDNKPAQVHSSLHSFSDQRSYLINEGIDSSESNSELIRNDALSDEQGLPDLEANSLGQRVHDFPNRNVSLNHDHPSEPAHAELSSAPLRLNGNSQSLIPNPNSPLSDIPVSNPTSPSNQDDGWGNFQGEGGASAWEQDPWAPEVNSTENWEWTGYQGEADESSVSEAGDDEEGNIQENDEEFDAIRRDTVALLPSFSQVLTWLTSFLVLLLRLALWYLSRRRHGDGNSPTPTASSSHPTETISTITPDNSSSHGDSNEPGGMAEPSVRDSIGEPRVFLAAKIDEPDVKSIIAFRNLAWQSEHPILIDDDGSERIGVELADALELIPRTLVQVIISRLAGNPSPQQHARVVITTSLSRTFKTILRLEPRPYLISSTSQLNMANADIVQTHYPRSEHAGIIESWFKPSAFRVYHVSTSASGRHILTCSITTPMRPPSISPIDSRLFKEPRGLLFFYIVEPPFSSEDRLLSGWRIIDIPRPMPSARFLYASHVAHDGRVFPSDSMVHRRPNGQQTTPLHGDAGNLRSSAAESSLEGGDADLRLMRGYFLDLVEGARGEVPESDPHPSEASTESSDDDDESEEGESEGNQDVDDGMSGVGQTESIAEDFEPRQGPESTEPQQEPSPTLLHPRMAASDIIDDVGAISDSFPTIKPLPLYRAYSPPQPRYRSFNRIFHTSTIPTDTPFNAPEDEVAAGLYPRQITKNADGTWTIVGETRDWFSKVYTFPSVDGGVIQGFQDPPAKHRVVPRYQQPWSFTDFAHTNIADYAHPDFREDRAEGLLRSLAPERTFDYTHNSDIILLLTTTVKTLDYVKHFCETARREQMALYPIKFGPEEYFDVPTPDNPKQLFTHPPAFASLVAVVTFSSRAHSERQARLNADLLDQRPKVFDRVEYSSETVYPDYAVHPNHPMQGVLAELAKSYYLELHHTLIWNTCQEPNHYSMFMQHEGRIDALAIVLLRVRQFLNIFHRILGRLGIQDEVERTMMPPGHYFQLHLYPNPLLNEGDVNYIFAAVHVLKKYHLYQVTDLIEGLLYYRLPDPGCIRILRVLGFLNWEEPAKMSDEVDKERFNDLLKFQRSTLNKSYGERVREAKAFLHNNGDVVEACFDSETFFPRRPTATDSQGFTAKYYSEQARQSATTKKPKVPIPEGAPIIDVDAFLETLSTHGVAEPV